MPNAWLQGKTPSGKQRCAALGSPVLDHSTAQFICTRTVPESTWTSLAPAPCLSYGGLSLTYRTREARLAPGSVLEARGLGHRVPLSAVSAGEETCKDLREQRKGDLARLVLDIDRHSSFPSVFPKPWEPASSVAPPPVASTTREVHFI